MAAATAKPAANTFPDTVLGDMASHFHFSDLTSVVAPTRELDKLQTLSRNPDNLQTPK